MLVWLSHTVRFSFPFSQLGYFSLWRKTKKIYIFVEVNSYFDLQWIFSKILWSKMIFQKKFYFCSWDELKSEEDGESSKRVYPPKQSLMSNKKGATTPQKIFFTLLQSLYSQFEHCHHLLWKRFWIRIEQYNTV